MLRTTNLLICCLLLLTTPAGTAEDFPRPLGYVNDYADILSAEEEARISSIISELQRKTSAEIAVVTMPEIGGQSEEIYANELFQAWGIGAKDKDNGILLFLTLEERRFRIETGYGLEGILPDGLLGQIADQRIIPFLREGRYGDGFLFGTAAIAQIIAEDAGVELSGQPELPPPPSGQQNDSRSLIRMAIFLILFMIIILSGGRMGILPLLFMGGIPRGRGGFGGGGFGGGFGGFGGGMSGGGGVSRGF